MKIPTAKIYLLLALNILSMQLAFSQCIPDPQYTTPGVYPDSSIGLTQGIEGNSYSTTITVVTEDSINVIGGIPTKQIIYTVWIDDIQGLPPGFGFTTPPPGQFFGGEIFCIKIIGTPLAGYAGVYPLTILRRIYTQGATTINEIHLNITKYSLVIVADDSITSNFSINANPICANSTVTFSNNSVNADTYSWSFPGGVPSSSTLLNPAVTYSGPGNFSATLTAYNTAGYSNVYSENFTVTACGLINGGFEDWTYIDSTAWFFDCGAFGENRHVSNHTATGWKLGEIHPNSDIVDLRKCMTSGTAHTGSKGVSLKTYNMYDKNCDGNNTVVCKPGEVAQAVLFAQPTTVRGIRLWYRQGSSNVGLFCQAGEGKYFYQPNGTSQWKLDSIVLSQPVTTTSFGITMNVTGRMIYENGYYTEDYHNPATMYICGTSVSVDDVELILDGVQTGINDKPEDKPSLLTVSNSHSGEIWLTYTVTENSPVKIQLFNLEGKAIREIINETYTPGTYRIDLKEMDLASGLYLAGYSTKSDNAVARVFIP